MSVAGICVGSLLFVAGIAGVVAPMLMIRGAMRYGIESANHRNVIANAVNFWIIGGPLGLIMGTAGMLTLLVSVLIYVDTRRKEAIKS